jgi:hypothetical protein
VGEVVDQSGLYSEHDNEPSDLVKSEECLCKLVTCRLLRKDPDPRSYLTSMLSLNHGTIVCTQPVNRVLKRELIVGSSSDWKHTGPCTAVWVKVKGQRLALA